MIFEMYNAINDILNSSPLIEMLINSLISIPIGFISGWTLQCIIDKRTKKQICKQQINDTINTIRCGEYINVNTHLVKMYSVEIIQLINQYNDCQQNIFDELRYVFFDLLDFKEKKRYRNIELYRWQYLNEEDLRLLNKICKLYLMEDFSENTLRGCTEIYAYICKTVPSSDGFELLSFMNWIDTSEAREMKNRLSIEKNKVIDMLKKVEC